MHEVVVAEPPRPLTLRTSGKRPRAVVIIPTFNEAATIAAAVERVFEAVRDLRDFEVLVLVVDSSSPDGTAGIVRGLQGRHADLHLVVEEKRSGLGGAYLYGMRHAVDVLGAEVLMEFDADLSHDPGKIPLFLARMLDGFDFVIGTRYSGGGSIPREWGLHRKFLSVLGNRVIGLALGGGPVTDWTGGFRAIHRRHFEALERELRAVTGYAFQTAFLHKALARGARVSEVPFHFTDRTAGDSKLRLSDVRGVLSYLGSALRERVTGSWRSGGEASRATRMAAVGAFGMLVHAAALAALVQLARLHPVAANLVAVQAALLSNFTGNELWTFQDRRRGRTLARYLRFVGGSLAGVVLVQTGAIWLGTRLFGNDAYFLSWVAGTGLNFLYNYLFASRVVWEAPARRVIGDAS
ncbi:MAG TPA: glycosyltransferase family 2 protein [Deinococcales bacterium]|nr:glycosyltransferase family 2 protein [Deinococcales bacterium]